MDQAPRYVGGQAVIEGVMMRSPRALAVAARRPDGTIVLREDTWISLFDRWPVLRWPLIRGSLVLIESLTNGLAALQFSALVQEQAARRRPRASVGEVERPSDPAPAPRAGDPAASALDRALAGDPTIGARPSAPPAELLIEPRDKRATLSALAVSFTLAMGLFVGLPHLLAWGTGRAIDVGVDQLGFHVLDGAFKLAIFVGYIWGIGRIPEIARVFQYHGAEHKAVNCHEQGRPLTLEEARRSTTFHARCGTSFLLFVLTLSIFVFGAILPLFPVVPGPPIAQHLFLIAVKIPLMAPLAGLAYEVNRFAARHPDTLVVQALVAPGRLMQKLTTREPTDDQLEIALTALRAAIAADVRLEAAVGPPARAHVAVFRDFREAEAALGAA